jgi:hypothetical protein
MGAGHPPKGQLHGFLWQENRLHLIHGRASCQDKHKGIKEFLPGGMLNFF